MKALTIMQPRASLLACGAKQYETRSWATKYRGEIAIHAAAKDPHGALIKLPWNIQKAMYESLYKAFDIESGAIAKMPTGAIIAMAELVNCHEITRQFIWDIEKKYLEPLRTPPEMLFGTFTIGRYAWEFKNMKILDEPIQVKGFQRLWNWSESV